MPSRLSLKKNIIWNSSGSFVYLFFQWLVTYLVVLLLGFEDAGIFSLALSVASIAFAFALYGIRGFQVSDLKEKYTTRTYLIARIVTSVIALSGVALYLFIYGYNSYTTLCILVYIFYKISEAYVDVYHGVIQKGLRMDYIGKSFIIRGVVTNILFIAIAFLTKDLLLAITIQALSSFALIALYDRRKFKEFYPQPTKTTAREISSLLVECMPLAIYVFLSNLILSVPRINLESALGHEILGIYASVAIPAAIIQVVAGFIFTPVLTVFADHVDKRNFKKFRSLLLKTFGYIAAFSAITILIGVLLGDFGLRILFGEIIAPYTYLFTPILFISSLTALSWFIGLMLTVVRDFKGLIISSSIAVSLCLLTTNWFINSYGINGVNYALISALLIQIIFMCIFMKIKIRSIQSV